MKKEIKVFGFWTILLLVSISFVQGVVDNEQQGAISSEDSYRINNIESLNQIAEREIIYDVEGDYQFKEEKYQGYIIEYKNEPVVKRKVKLDKVAEENEKYVKKASVYDSRRIYIQQFGVMPENVDNKVKQYSKSLKTKNKKIKEDILTKINKKRTGITGNLIRSFITKITGKAVYDSKFEEELILGEFENTFNGIALDISDEEAEEIKNLPEVKSVSPNLEVKAMLMDSAPLINADDVWLLDKDGNNCTQTGKQCLTGEGVTIAIIDTGIDYTHLDLGGCFGTACKVIGSYDFVNNDADPIDDNGHGTHVAGIAAGNGALKGVAPDAKLYAYKVLDSHGSGSFANTIAAIERAVDPNQDGNFSDKIDVISMSLGGGGNPDDPISQAVDNVVDAGVVAVIAAGNSGPTLKTINSPGTARKAITVGATHKNDSIASFSSRGPVIWTDSQGNQRYLTKPDIVAPGVNICSAQYNGAWNSKKCLDDKHVAISGTSMATPHVAGAVALLKQKNPDWTPEEIKMASRKTAVDIGEPIESQGYGRLNILNAVNFNGIPSIAKLETKIAIVKPNDLINITGTASGRDFNKYTLYYGKGNNPNIWEEITTRNVPIEDDILYSNFNTNLLYEGYNFFKLAVWNNNGEKIEDINKIYFLTEEITEKQITTDSFNQGVPRISENRIVWIDTRNNNFDIYMYDLSVNEERAITTDINYQSWPDIYSNKIVWTDTRNNSYDIYLYDLSTNEEKAISTMDRDSRFPSVSSNKIIWDTYTLPPNLKYPYYDLIANKIKWLSFSALSEMDTPSLSKDGEKIVSSIFGDIYIYDFVLNEEKIIPIGSAMSVFNEKIYISGNKVVWEDLRNGNYDIYMYDLSTNEEIQVTTDPSGQRRPSISGNKIVWEDFRDGRRIYIYDITTREEKQLTPYPSTQGYPYISGDKIVWQDYRNGNWDVYIYKIEKPSTLTNNENQEVTGTLKLILQKYDLIGAWIDEQVVINEQKTLAPLETVDLSISWNSVNVSAYSIGDYRIYASFESAGQKKEAVYEFGVG